MSSSGRRQGPPRAVRLHRHRLVLTLASVLALPLALSACGLIGGHGEDQGPVVIPSEAADDGASPADPAATETSASGAGGLAPADPISTDAANPVPPQVNATVTKTGIVVQNRTQTRTRTATATATKTLPQVTLPQVTVTQPPITLTETRTETRTVNATVTVPVPGPTRTIICSGTPQVCV